MRRRFPALRRDIAPIAFGSFKIGRNEGIKYAQGYALPTDAQACTLLHGILDMGVDAIDTAPAYGLAEHRIGRCLVARRQAAVIMTKAGERFEAGSSHYDFSGASVARSIRESMARLCTDWIDVVHVHSDGSDLAILRDGSAISAIADAQRRGEVGAVGFSPKSLEGAMACLADARIGSLMVEYHPLDRSMEPALDEAARRGVAVLVKKPLASGKLSPAEAIPAVLAHPAVTAAVIGTLSLEHLAESVRLAGHCAQR